jgi:hypothetical protein
MLPRGKGNEKKGERMVVGLIVVIPTMSPRTILSRVTMAEWWPEQ